MMSIKNEVASSRLIVGDSRSMIEVDDDSVALTVTSPPYWNAIDYDLHATDPSMHYRTRVYDEGFGDYGSYLDWAVEIFSEVLKKTKPGGFLAVVIGTVLLNGVHYPVPFDLTARLTKSGWLFHQDIIWHKTTAGVKRAGSFIQHPYPGYFYPNIMTEYILIFRKLGESIYKGVAEERKRLSSYTIGTLFTNEVANNIWHIAPVPPRTLDHPCPFPEEIPYRLIGLYSYVGDVVLDPFVGSGQTSKVAVALGRVAVGYDIIEKYVGYARARLGEPLSIRPNQLVANFGKIELNAPLGAVGKTRNKHE